VASTLFLVQSQAQAVVAEVTEVLVQLPADLVAVVDAPTLAH
jgi:hypothetical protein